MSGRLRILWLDSPAARAYRRGMKTSFLSAAVFALLMSLFSPQAWADDLKAMDGTWKIEKAEAGGKVIEAEELKAVVVTIKDGRYEVTLPDKKDVGTLKVDEAAKPKTMDATVTEGLEAGKVTKAIYELNGDSMRDTRTYRNLFDGAFHRGCAHWDIFFDRFHFIGLPLHGHRPHDLFGYPLCIVSEFSCH